jgi:hypothetical protein
MKTLITVTLSLLLAAGAAWAERPDGGQHSQDKRAERMAHMQQQLGLSDDQVAQMKDIRSNGGSREDMRAVLSDDQQAQMKELRKQRQAKQDGKGGRRPPPQHEDEGEGEQD